MTTIRDLLNGLSELAAALPDGLDTPIEAGVCNGENLHLLDNVDVDHWERHADGPASSPEVFVLLRGHLHPNENRPERVLRGVAAGLDDELRQISDNEGGQDLR